MSYPITRIIIADTDISFTRRLRVALERAGNYDVCEVNRSEDALEATLHFRPHVILLEIVMRTINGTDFELCLRARECLRETSVLFLASLVDRHDEGGFAFRDSDGRAYLSKPVSLSALRNCIHHDLPLWNQTRIRAY